AVDRACELLKAKGAKRAIKLNVSAPFHCALMMPAQERLEQDLNELIYSDLSFPIVHNVDAKANSSAGYLTEALTKQVSSPVRWLECAQELKQSGVTTFIEVGAGKVLSGLARQIDREIRTLNVEDSQSLRSTLESL
ncbi:MAG TPA: ACP S-malonyltransferase, partial [Pyrinomonadaceae bacterium]|nr:ACP S-malonyltransferase [Pyrinomonadaceae bacterium]